jgi:predicted TIM-barrel fold metal-dependent hydrolase
MRTDVHQHLWSPALCGALAARGAPPRLAGDGERWTLWLAGEPPCALRLAGDALDERRAELAADGLDLALIALSGALGVEGLAPDEARALVGAYDAGIDALPPALRGWGALALRDAAPGEVDRLLDRGRVGLCLPAGALAGRPALDRVGPLLERLTRRDAPLFVHPGPSPWAHPAPPEPGVPSWWPAMTDYVGQMHVAWHTWVAAGRAEHPRLRVVFAMLAGGAPLHVERLALRAGEDTARGAAADPLTFYDTSSYGPVALDAVERLVGPGQLVHGSDRPVVVPALPEGAAARRRLVDNPRRLLGGRPLEAAA